MMDLVRMGELLLFVGESLFGNGTKLKFGWLVKLFETEGCIWKLPTEFFISALENGL